MPPKNNITLDRGEMFFQSLEGPQPLGSIYEGETLGETEETVEPWPKENPYLLKQPQDATFTAETRISPDIAEAFKAVGDLADTLTKTLGALWQLVKRTYEMYARYPNKRVKHLALYAKKKRTRKKNMRRIARELLKEVEP